MVPVVFPSHVTVGPLEQDNGMSGRGDAGTNPRCRATGCRTAGRVTPNLRIEVHRSVGTARFANVGFPPAAPAGSGVDVGEGLLENTGQLPGGTRERLGSAPVIGCPARAILSQLTHLEMPSTARIGKKKSAAG